MGISLQEFSDLTATYNGAILYQPLSGEIDYNKPLFPINLHPNQMVLPVNTNENPFAWADKCAEYFKKDIPYVLVPGSNFDIYGTRHGRGGGWYDRFLSKIPTTWLKIGITDTSRLSFQQIAKRPWDQTVDWVLACDSGVWNIYKVTP
ncbi:MAG: 5-formyltetrahydrofolate cyclo-ligase [bacterium]|nr:5-formyltetrahydrofolate cyclo-ligase [bacterium]